MDSFEELHVIANGTCSNNCVFCFERRESDGAFPAREQYLRLSGKPYLSPEHFKKHLIGLRCRTVMFEGGEPTLNPALPELARTARAMGVRRTGIVTNGRSLKDISFCRTLVESGITSFVFSIHGSSAAVHDSLTRSPSSFDELSAGLANIISLKKRFGLRIMTNTVLTRLNMNDIPRLLEFLAGLRAIDKSGLFVFIPNGRAAKNFKLLSVKLSEFAGHVSAGLDSIPRRFASSPKGRGSPVEKTGGEALSSFRAGAQCAACFASSVSVAGLPYCLLPENKANLGRFEPVAVLGPDGISGKGVISGVKAPQCQGCAHEKNCDGIWEGHAERGGRDELNPFRVCLAGLRIDKSRPQPPLALGYLKAYADSASALSRAKISITQAWTGENRQTLCRKLLAGKPDVIGFSCYVWNILKVLELCRLIKKLRPGARLVLGGPEASNNAAEILKKHPVDYVVIGEGELTFSELLAALMNKKPHDAIAGLAYKKKGRAVFTPQRPPIENLDSLPSPYLTGALIPPPGCDLAVETSRGCPHGCYFCGWRNNEKTRYFPVRRIVKELRFLAERGPAKQAPGTVCTVTDSDFFRSPQRAAGLVGTMREISDRKKWSWVLTSYFGGAARVDFPELNSNRFFVLAGIQSTNRRALAECRRFGFDFKKNESAIRSLKKAAPGCSLQLELILGLPGDSLDGFKKTMDWALSMPVNSVIVFQCLVLSGSGLWKNARRLGINCDKTPPFPVRSLKGFPRADIERARFLSYAVAILRRDRVIRRGLEAVSQRISRSVPLPHLYPYELLIKRLEKNGKGFSLSRHYAAGSGRKLLSFEEPLADGRGPAWLDIKPRQRREVLKNLKTILREIL